jgi:4'-phosphopantetheinyl transferase
MSEAPRDEHTIRIDYAFVDERRDQDPRLLELLSADERARHGRLHFARDRAAFLLAHSLLRSLLSEQIGGEPASHRFEAGAHGKPALEPPLPALDFNLSHTKGLVACALAWHADVGVDVEHATRTVDLDGVGRRVFSASEQAVLAALSEEARADRFFEYWTLKEAYMKARGLGFSLPPASFELTALPGAGYALRHLDAPDPAAGWSFHATRLGQHRLACAVAAPGRVFCLEERRL